MDERFSACLDNEAPRDDVEALITSALADPDTRACWTRQHWVRAAIQAAPGEAQPRLDSDFSNRVMAAILADEQTAVLASESANDDASKVVPLSSRKSRRANRTGWRNGFGAAAAASVVGVVVFAYAPVGTQDSARNIDNAGGAIATQPVSTGATQTVATGRSQGFGSTFAASDRQSRLNSTWSVSDPALRRELNSYLVEHHGLARTFGFAASAPSLVQSVAYSSQPSP